MIDLNSCWRVIRGPKSGHILIIGNPRGRATRQKYWAMDITGGTKGLITARELEQNCEKIEEEK